MSSSINVDFSLDLSNSDFSHRIKNLSKCTGTLTNANCNVYPSPYVLALLTNKVYMQQGDKSEFEYEQDLELPHGWKLLTTAHSGSQNNTYFGAAFFNPEFWQIVVIHRVNDVKIKTFTLNNAHKITLKRYTKEINSAVTFADKVKTILTDINKLHRMFYNLSFTGHSVGGSLAQITAFSTQFLSKNNDAFTMDNNLSEIYTHTVIFDSLGIKNIADKFEKWAKKFNTLDITNYLCVPNILNTCSSHIGTLNRIFPDVPSNVNKNISKYNLETHSMDCILTAFDSNTGHVFLDKKNNPKMQKVLEWPVKKSLPKSFFKWAKQFSCYNQNDTDDIYKSKFWIIPRYSLHYKTQNCRNAIDINNATMANSQLCMINEVNDNAGTHSPTEVQSYDESTVKSMIGCVDVNYQNKKTKLRAIDIAWENGEYGTMLTLLEQNSVYPNNFKLSDLSDLDENDNDLPKLKGFVTEREEFHLSITKGDLKNVESFMLKNKLSMSSLLFNCKQESAIETAAMHGNVDIFSFLLNLKSPVHDEIIKLTDEQEKLVNFINNDNGNTLLMLAAHGGRNDNIEFFLRCGVEIDHCNKVGHTAADIAWVNKHYNVLLILLEADCSFPKDFSLEKFQSCDHNEVKLQEFIERRSTLHSLIKQGNLKEVKNFITKNKKSKYYLNSHNTSALSYAIKCKKYEVYAFLKSKECQFISQKEKTDSLSELNETEQFHLKEAMLHHFIPSYQSHILYLVSKSKSSTPVENFEDTVQNYYTKLDSIPEISIILKVLQYAEYTDIVFDFHGEVVSDVDPTSSNTTKGSCDFKKGRIYIGAKGEKSEILGTLAHELTHYAMQIIYDNNCNPYSTNNNGMDKKFQSIIKKLRKQIEDENLVNDVIQNVFSNYSEDKRDSELVVRIPHLYAKYGQDIGQQIVWFQVPDLLTFYKEHIMPDCEKFVQTGYHAKPRNTIKVMQKLTGDMNDVLDPNISLKQSIDVTNFLNSVCNILFITSRCEWFSSLSILQTLNELYNKISDESYLFLKYSNFSKLKKDVLGILNCELLKFLLISFDTKTNKSRVVETLKTLKPFINDIEKKFIFIMHENLESELKNCLNQVQIFEKYELYKDKQYTLLCLSDESQKIILNKKVTFQGYKVYLRDLINDALKGIFDGRIIYKLIKDEKVEIGSEISNLGEVKSYYINRYFKKYMIRWETIINDKSKDKFTFSGNAAKTIFQTYQTNTRFSQCGHVSPDIKFLLLDEDSAETQFRNLCSQFPQYNIHWINITSSEITWRKTQGYLYNLRKCIENSNNYKEISEENIDRDNKDKFIIISDTAGTGKSTILARISEIIKQENTFIYVIDINLNDSPYVDILLEEVNDRKQTHKQFESFDAACNFLVDQLLRNKIKDNFNKRFLKNILRQEKRAVLLFDGFDEISPDYAELVIDLLKWLGKSQVKHIIVSTRRSFKEMLEDHLRVLSHSLRPFTEEDQIAFLVKFWNNYNPQFNMLEKLKAFAKILVKCFSKTIDDKVKEFTGIPLLTRMLAEFDHKLETFYNSEEETSESIENIEVLALYNNFFWKTYERYCIEKKTNIMSKLATKEDSLKQYKVFLHEHEILALFALFKREELEKISHFENVDTYIENINAGKERTGIIDKVIGGKPHFIHRTFAENRAAAFFISRREIDKGMELQEFLRQNIFKPENEILRKFFDYMCSESNPTITAAINNDVRCLTSADLSLESFDAVDIEGRNVLHSSGSHGNKTFLEKSLKLLQSKISSIDNLFGYTSLQYSCLSCNWGCAELLLEASANSADLIIIRNLLFEICKADAILEVAFDKNYHHLTRAVFSLTEDVEGLCILLTSNSLLFPENKPEIVDILGQKIKDVLNHFSENSENSEEALIPNNLKAQLGLSDDGQFTLLHIAAHNGGIDSVKILVKHGIFNINVVDYEGNTPLHEAAYSEFEEYHSSYNQIINHLVKNGADINKPNKIGYAPLHNASYCSYNVGAVKILLECGADPNFGVDIGMVPLHCAVLSGNPTSVEIMLNYGAEPYSKGLLETMNITSLHIASLLPQNVKSRNIIMEQLLKKFPNIINNEVKVTGENLAELIKKFQKSVRSSCPWQDWATGMLQPVKRSCLSLTARDISCNLENKNELDKEKLVTLLDKYGAQKSSNLITGTFGKIVLKITKNKFLNYLQNIIWTNQSVEKNIERVEDFKLFCYVQAICRSAQSSDLEHLIYDYSLLPETNINVAPFQNRTPLHWSAEDGNIKVVEYILKQKEVLVNLKDNDGKTPLHLAAENGHKEVVKKLLDDKKACINETDNDGNTALDLARKEDYIEIVTMLSNAQNEKDNEEIASDDYDNDDDMEAMDVLF